LPALSIRPGPLPDNSISSAEPNSSNAPMPRKNPDYQKKYRAKNADRLALEKRDYYLNNKEKCLARSKEWYRNNKEKCLESAQNYYLENRDACIERSRLRSKTYECKKYRRESIKVYESNARRRASRVLATPPWMTSRHLSPIYAESRRVTKSTGIQHHVDHIYPLSGPNFSGLHVPWNLQILTASENCKKGNRTWPR
jgi:hypothetical protein